MAELRESQAPILVSLGDQPIRWFLHPYDFRWGRLSDFQYYGRLHPAKIDGIEVQIVPLAHPR